MDVSSRETLFNRFFSATILHTEKFLLHGNKNLSEEQLEFSILALCTLYNGQPVVACD